MSIYKIALFILVFTPLTAAADRPATLEQIRAWCEGSGEQDLRVTNMTKAEACRFYGYDRNGYAHSQVSRTQNDQGASPTEVTPLQTTGNGEETSSASNPILTNTGNGDTPPPLSGPSVSGDNPCQSPELTSLIPQANNEAPRFPRAQDEYLTYAEEQIRGGNIPDHIRQLVPVQMEQGSGSCMGSSEPITLCAMPEPISIGPSSNYAYSPIRYSQAHQIARDFGMILPTEAMVDATLQTSGATHVSPLTRPWYSGNGGDGTMTQPYRFREQSDAIRGQLNGSGNGNLVVGSHKDYILRNGVGMNDETFTQLSLYGWHRNTDPSSRWQPAGIQHGDSHVDYSQTPRFYSQWAVVNGRWENLTGLLQNPECAATLNGGSALNSTIANAFANPEARPPATAVEVAPIEDSSGSRDSEL